MNYTIQDLKKDMSERTHQHWSSRGGQDNDLNLVQVQVREANRQLILNYIRKHGTIDPKSSTRIAIAQRTGLSRTTVGKIIDDLKDDGWVSESDQPLESTSRGGHKATPIYFNAKAGYVIGIDIGRSHFTHLLTDLEAEEIGRDSDELDTDSGAEACLDLLVERLQKLLKDKRIPWNKVIGIGVGIPGTLDPQLKMLTGPMMPGWQGINIPQYLRRRVRGVPVYLDNDANMGALGEIRYGSWKNHAGKDITNLVYVKIGTGIGAGLILDGHLYRGNKGAAGEIGHTKISEASSQSARSENCANYECTPGCLESLAAEQAILKDAHYDTSLKGNESILSRDDDRQTLLAIVKVARAAQNGDETSRFAIENAGKCIGVAIGNLTNLLNPELILLGGGVVHAAGELLLTPLRHAAEACSLPATKSTPIEKSKLGYDASAKGAVATVIDAIDIAFTQNRAVRDLVVTNRR